jgi:photosystem II stability/assembly factor-like uncharacterized protein
MRSVGHARHRSRSSRLSWGRKVVLSAELTTDAAAIYAPPMLGAARRRSGGRLVLGVVAVLFAFGGPLAAQAGALDEWSSPLLLRPGVGLEDQYGYAPAYTRNVPAFDSGNRAYLRSRTSSISHTSYVHAIEDGGWKELGFREALRDAYPDLVSTVGGGGLRNDRVIFDRQDRAYNPVTIKLKDGSLRNVLMVSWDLCRTWTLFELPAGEFAVEHRVGPEQIDGPPFLAVWRPSKFNPAAAGQPQSLWVTKPRLEGDRLVIPPLALVTHECLGLHKDSGGGSFAVTQGTTTAFVWAGATPTGGRATPQYVATYDHVSGEVSEPELLASTSPANDTHNKPSICSDGQGYLHFVAGPHGTASLYRRSLEPRSATAGWTPVEPVLADGYIDPLAPAAPSARQTYNALVCDSSDTLHLVSRQWRRGADDYHDGREYGALVHQSRPRDGAWGTPTIIVVAAEPGYGIYHHKLALDHRDRLFLSCSYSGGIEHDQQRAWAADMQKLGRAAPHLGRYRRRMLLLSDDGGAHWRLARDRDLAAPGQTVVAPAEPLWPIAPTLPPVPATWSWARPLPQGNQISDIDFVSKRTGWAVGTYGSILRSVDGGLTWRRQTSGTRMNLYGVAAVDAKTAWAVGQGGVILRTVDGGRTWRRQNSRTTRTFFSISAQSAQAACAVGHRGVVRVTGNGGSTWLLRSTKRVVPLFASTFVGKHGWAVGADGTIVATSDGGHNWTRQPRKVSATLYAVAFFDRSCGVALGSGSVLLYTRDGGRTWGRSRTGGLPTIRAARMVSRNVVHAVGGDGSLLRSADGGRTWTRRQLPLKTLTGALEVHQGRAWAGGVGGVITRSSDGGRTWSSVERGLTTTLNATATSGGRAWVAGGGGRLAVTSDEGRSWLTQKTGTTAEVKSLAVAHGEGWAVGSGGLVLKSADGGLSWQRVARPVATSLNAVSTPAAGRAWVAGDEGALLGTRDGGASWTKHTLASEDLRCVAFLGRNGWTGGGDPLGDRRGLLLRTRDDGRSWEEIRVPVWGVLTDLEFVDPMIGWAVALDWGRDGDARGGAVLATRDGGRSWRVQVRVPEALTSVHMTSELCGWAFGEGGMALQTADGGHTWTRRAVRTDSALRGAAVGSSGSSLVVGDGGAVLKGTPAQ